MYYIYTVGTYWTPQVERYCTQYTWAEWSIDSYLSNLYQVPAGPTSVCMYETNASAHVTTESIAMKPHP